MTLSRSMLASVVLLLSTSAHSESGIASVYGNGDGYAWKPVACGGGKMDPGALTAAHKTLRCGSHVTVTNARNGRSVVVRITDRGPFIKGRIIDLTPAAALALACDGLCPVTVQ